MTQSNEILKWFKIVIISSLLGLLISITISLTQVNALTGNSISLPSNMYDTQELSSTDINNAFIDTGLTGTLEDYEVISYNHISLNRLYYFFILKSDIENHVNYKNEFILNLSDIASGYSLQFTSIDTAKTSISAMSLNFRKLVYENGSVIYNQNVSQSSFSTSYQVGGESYFIYSSVDIYYSNVYFNLLNSDFTPYQNTLAYTIEIQDITVNWLDNASGSYTGTPFGILKTLQVPQNTNVASLMYDETLQACSSDYYFFANGLYQDTSQGCSFELQHSLHNDGNALYGLHGYTYGDNVEYQNHLDNHINVQFGYNLIINYDDPTNDGYSTGYIDGQNSILDLNDSSPYALSNFFGDAYGKGYEAFREGISNETNLLNITQNYLLPTSNGYLAIYNDAWAKGQEYTLDDATFDLTEFMSSFGENVLAPFEMVFVYLPPIFKTFIIVALSTVGTIIIVKFVRGF